MKSHSTSKPEQTRHHGSTGQIRRGQADLATAVADSRPEMEHQQGLLSLMSGSSRLQRTCACGTPSAAGGTCTACQEKAAGAGPQALQKKLAIGAADDPLEREADRVADQVMQIGSSAQDLQSVAPLRIQRVKSYSSSSGGEVEVAPPSVEKVLSGSGRVLEPGIREVMEKRFGHDFSEVRLHSGADATRSAREVNANAYTVGKNIVVADGGIAHSSVEYQRLIAHELTHVIQQGGVEGALQRDVAADKTIEVDEKLGLSESIPIETIAAVASGPFPMLRTLFKGGLIGFYTELRLAVRKGKGEELWKRFKALATSPSEILALYKGYLWGVLQGLWSPIQGLVDLAKLGWTLQQWQLEVLKNVLGNLEELVTLKGTLSQRFSRIGVKLRTYFNDKKSDVAGFLEGLVSAAQAGLLDLAKSGGHLAGKAFLGFAQKPWGDIGEGVGVVVGTVLVEVLMAYFSAGIANAATKLGEVLGKVAPTLMKGVRFIAQEVRAVLAELHLLVESIKQGVAKAGTSLLKGLEGLGAELGGLLDDLVAFFRKLLGGAEDAAAKVALDVPVPSLGHTPGSGLPGKASTPKPVEVRQPTSPAKASSASITKEGKASVGDVKPLETTHPPLTDQFKAEAIKRVEKNPGLIQGEPGHRRAPVGDGHEIVEVPDRGLPSGIGCELHSPPPPVKVKCPGPMGTKTTEDLIKDFKNAGGEIKKVEPGKVPQKSPSEVTAVGEPKLPEGFDDLDAPTRTEKQAGVRVGEDHHVLTRFRKENKTLLEKIGFDIDDDFNLIKDFREHGELRGWEKWSPTEKRFIHVHKGHHPGYNDWATNKAKNAVKGLRGERRKAALRSAIQDIGSIVEKNPEILAYGPDVLSRSSVLR